MERPFFRLRDEIRPKMRMKFHYFGVFCFSCSIYFIEKPKTWLMYTNRSYLDYNKMIFSIITCKNYYFSGFSVVVKPIIFAFWPIFSTSKSSRFVKNCRILMKFGYVLTKLYIIYLNHFENFCHVYIHGTRKTTYPYP